MVSIDCLAALDHLIWLKTGQRAAAQLGTTQPTISRNTRHCSEVFEIQVAKKAGEWEVLGDPSLLNAERWVHQRHRWERQSPLRLDGDPRAAPYLQAFTPTGWIQGNGNHHDPARAFDLIRSGILDAWIGSAPTLPEDPALAAWQLSASPIHQLVVRAHFAHHPRTTQLAHDLLQHLRRNAADLHGLTVLDQPVIHSLQAAPAAPRR